MAVTFGGIASGIDTKAIIQATLAAQRAPLDKLGAKKSAFTSQISDLGKLGSKLEALQTMAKDMAKTSNVLAFQFSVGDEEVLGATADGAAAAGRYDIEVTQLATAEKNRSSAFNSNFSEVQAGTLTIQTAGADPIEITIEEGDTIERVAERINASGAKVDATLMRDGTSTYLQITASESGHTIGGNPDDAITITESYSGGSGQELGLAQVVQAKNATFTVDGLAAQSRSNTPNDIIPGLELQLKKLGTSSLEVRPDKDGTKEKIKAFVDLANEVMDLVRSNTRTSNGARKVDSDPAIERLGTELRGLVLQSVAGLSSQSSSLSRIGIETTASGRLQIDNSRFDEALSKDLRGIGRLFTTEETGLSARLEVMLERYTDSVDGVLGNRRKALNNRLDQLDSQMERMTTRLERTQGMLQKQFSAMEQALAGYQAQGNALSALLFMR